MMEPTPLTSSLARPRSRRQALAALAALLLLWLGTPRAVNAEEGLWLPEQIAELDRTQLASRGLELTAKQLWSDAGGLLRASVNVSGCSAAFVSKSGLVATNHHCAYRAIQAQSTPERDLLKLGFVARKRSDELEAKGYTLHTVESIEDVTSAVLADTKNASDDRARWAAIERAQKRLSVACETKHPGLRCDVASFYWGSQFRLIKKRELTDIRLVYAPPSSIGNFGGEVDNWMWPRHTGDFALLRAYAAPKGPATPAAKNVPYEPAQWLEIGHEGVGPGDFVAVLGYPGSTRRYLPSAAIERHVRETFPASIGLYEEWLGKLEAIANRSAAQALRLAAQRKTLANRLKHAQGALAGLKRASFVDKRRTEERQLAELAKKPEYAAHASALGALSGLARAQAARAPRDFLLDQLSSGPPLLALGVDLVRRAREKKKPELERELPYMDRNASLLYKALERRQRDFVPEAEAELLASLLRRARALPKTASIEPLERLAPGDVPDERLASSLLPRVRASRLGDADYVRRLFDAGELGDADLADPLLALAAQLADEIALLEEQRKAERGLEARVATGYFALWKALRGGMLYPDANGTLRFSYARVMGYEPEDGLLARPQTTLLGALRKHTGTPPFDLPKLVRERAFAAKHSYWTDALLDDLPLCFLANADTSGGNSGSPIIDGKGRLVGLNFDRVWENVASDFGYSPERSRNVSVDVRYLLWLLDRVDNAGHLLAELGVAAYRADARKRDRPGTQRTAKQPPEAADGNDTGESRCACRVPGASSRPVGGLGALALVLCAFARSRARGGLRRAGRSLRCWDA
jgi:hypothetical protein